MCVFITVVPITKLFAWGRGIVEDMCYEIQVPDKRFYEWLSKQTFFF